MAKIFRGFAFLFSALILVMFFSLVLTACKLGWFFLEHREVWSNLSYLGLMPLWQFVSLLVSLSGFLFWAYFDYWWVQPWLAAWKKVLSFMAYLVLAPVFSAALFLAQKPLLKKTVGPVVRAHVLSGLPARYNWRVVDWMARHSAISGSEAASRGKAVVVGNFIGYFTAAEIAGLAPRESAAVDKIVVLGEADPDVMRNNFTEPMFVKIVSGAFRYDR
ncbi:MAG: hypothetical protein AABZ44_05010 [Elusimicrobiota bacterium]